MVEPLTLSEGLDLTANAAATEQGFLKSRFGLAGLLSGLLPIFLGLISLVLILLSFTHCRRSAV